VPRALGSSHHPWNAARVTNQHTRYLLDFDYYKFYVGS
jgi:hypothetical protein